MQGYGVETSDWVGLSAREAGLARCPACGSLHRLPITGKCRRCGHSVSVRRKHSLQRTWAFLIVGLFFYVPANLYPIMLTHTFAGKTSDTILSGVFALVDSGSWGIAIIIFIASICIPVTKFTVIGGLALSLQLHWTMSEHTRHRLHTLTEFIGRWSMVDVFVVAVLAALIQLGAILTVTPGIGINAFAASVVFTMLAASSLDSRLIWDQLVNSETGGLPETSEPDVA